MLIIAFLIEWKGKRDVGHPSIPHNRNEGTAVSFHPSKLFPTEQEWIAFGHWLSGFTDGEDSFTLNYTLRKGRPIFRSQFRIRLRRDDDEILKRIRMYLRCGRVYYGDWVDPKYNQNPSAMYVVSNLKDLATRVVLHYDHYPLFAKKKRDFFIWREAILTMYRVLLRPQKHSPVHYGALPKYTDQEIGGLIKVVHQLKEIRKYDTELPQVPVLRHKMKPKGFFSEWD